jgi:hypothetical protein
MKRLKYAPILLALVAFSLAAACGVGGPAANNDATKDHTATTEPSAEGQATTHEETSSTTTASSQDRTRQASTTYQIEVFRGTEVFFPQQRRPVGIGPAAGAVGKLVVDDDGCIRLKPTPKDPGYIPIWPAEFELEVAGGEIRILDGMGQVVAKVGEEVDLMGGEAGSSLEGFGIVDKRTKRELYERCRLRSYWFVSPDTPRAGP